MPQHQRRHGRFASKLALALSWCLIAPAVGQPDEGAPPHTRADYYAAFAKLYGYVRYFHPADEAALADWDRLAVHGARRMAAVESPEALRAALEEIFLPLAPTLRIYPEGDEPAAPPRVKAQGKVRVAWQHRGVGLGREPYRSERINRNADPLALTNSAGRYIDNEDYEGLRYRFSAQVRADAGPGRSGGRLFLQVMNDRFENYIDEDFRDRLVRDPAWTRVELTGTFDQATRFITYGIGLAGLGEACFDDVRFEVAPANGEWRELEVENGGFETTLDGAPRNWDFAGYGYRFSASEVRPFGGERTGCIRSVDGHVVGSLFQALPEAGEEIDKALGAGLRARLPLSLWLDESPATEVPERLSGLLAEIESFDLEALTSDDLATRVAAISIAWNVFQHFYPYFDVVPTDWNGVLPGAMNRALEDRGAAGFRHTLKWLLAQLHDGHASVFHAGSRIFFLDIKCGWIEQQLVVLEPLDSMELEPGDVIETIDGEPAREVLERIEARQSGSRQWRRRLAVRWIATGDEGTPVSLGIRRGGARSTVEVAMAAPARRTTDDPTLRQLEDGIWLVDLTRATMAEINDELDELASARGVVFDLRGYPNSNHDVLRHLTDVPLRSAKWQVPQIIYPDRERLAGYDTSGRWTLDPRPPRFQGKIVFLTDARAISYAESVMGIVEHYRLGEIVGEPTAGTNGNVNRLALPGGYHLSWTGMRVIKHDDSQHHLIGILPTVPAVRTVEGVRAGRDELIEVALRLIADG